MVAKSTLAILIALCAAAGARELQQAPSPAPTMLPIADMAFILSADEVLSKRPQTSCLDFRKHGKEHGFNRLSFCRRSSQMLVTLRCITPARVHSTTAPVLSSHLLSSLGLNALIAVSRVVCPRNKPPRMHGSASPSSTKHSQL